MKRLPVQKVGSIALKRGTTFHPVKSMEKEQAFLLKQHRTGLTTSGPR